MTAETSPISPISTLTFSLYDVEFETLVKALRLASQNPESVAPTHAGEILKRLEAQRWYTKATPIQGKVRFSLADFDTTLAALADWLPHEIPEDRGEVAALYQFLRIQRKDQVQAAWAALERESWATKSA